MTKVENGNVYTKEGNNTGGKIGVHERPAGASWIWYGWCIKSYATHEHSFLETFASLDDYRHYPSYDFCRRSVLKAVDVIVAMSTNFQDALSMSSFACAYRVLILLQTDDDYGRCLTDGAREFVGEEGTICVPGGPAVLSYESVEDVFSADRVVRLRGQDGYDTSSQIASYMVLK